MSPFANFSSGSNKITNLRIARLLIQETGTYNNQFLRPYNTELNGQTMNAIADAAVNTRTGQLDPTQFAALSTGFIQKQAAPEGEIAIANGWSERRVRFMMEVTFEYQIGTTVSMFLLGYTDFVGVSESGSIAPDMTFYINSAIKTRNTITHTPMGVNVIQNPYDCQHYVNGSASFGNMYGGPGQSIMTMRPTDVYKNLAHTQFETDGHGRSVLDLSAMTPPTSVPVDRALCTPANYVTNVLNTMVAAGESAELGNSFTNIMDKAISMSMESPADITRYNFNNPFLMAISSVRGNAPVSNFFTYKDLVSIDPNVSNVTNYAVLGGTERAQVHHAGQTESWQGSDLNTKVAASLSHSVSGLMMENLITRIVFKSTNLEIGGRMRTDIIHGRGFSNMDMTLNYQRFKFAFENLVLREITFNNALGYALEMNVDLLGETWIKISIDNGPIIDYVTPSFSDALFSPLVTRNGERLGDISQDFSTLYDTISENMGSHSAISQTKNSLV